MTKYLHLSSGEVYGGLEALNQQPTPLRLQTEKSPHYYSFRGPRKTGAQLQINSSKFVPLSIRNQWDSVTLSMNIVGGEIAPRLQLTAFVRDAKSKLIHEGILNFFPDGTQDTTANTKPYVDQRERQQRNRRGLQRSVQAYVSVLWWDRLSTQPPIRPRVESGYIDDLCYTPRMRLADR